MDNRQRIEWRGGIIRIKGHDIAKMTSEDFGNLLEKIDKRLFNPWSDGVTIYFLTPRQLSKFNKLLSK